MNFNEAELGYDSMADSLPSMHKALGLISSNRKKNKYSSIFFKIVLKLSYFLCVYIQAYMQKYACRSQRATCRIQFSLSTIWIPGIKQRTISKLALQIAMQMA